MTLGHVYCNYSRPTSCLILIKDNFMYLFSNEPGVLNIATPGTSVFHRRSGTPRRGRGHVAAGGRGFWRPGSSVLRLPSAPAETNTESPFPPELLRLPRYRLVGVFPPNVTSLVRFPCRRLSSPPGDLTHKLRGVSVRSAGVRGPLRGRGSLAGCGRGASGRPPRIQRAW